MQLAAQIDNRIGELTAEVGVASNDARLMLMAGLVIADELECANDRIVELETEVATLRGEAPPAASRLEPGARPPRLTKIDEEKFAGILESAARRMEDIAARLA